MIIETVGILLPLLAPPASATQHGLMDTVFDVQPGQVMMYTIHVAPIPLPIRSMEFTLTMPEYAFDLALDMTHKCGATTMTQTGRAVRIVMTPENIERHWDGGDVVRIRFTAGDGCAGKVGIKAQIRVSKHYQPSQARIETKVNSVNAIK